MLRELEVATDGWELLLIEAAGLDTSWDRVRPPANLLAPCPRRDGAACRPQHARARCRARRPPAGG